MLGDSAEKLSLICFYFGDLLRILDRDEVKETEMPASFAYISDGKFESFRLLSRDTDSERSLWHSLEMNTEDEHKVNRYVQEEKEKYCLQIASE